MLFIFIQAKVSPLPPGSKVISLEDLEREMTQSPTFDNSSLSPSHRPGTRPLSPSSHSPAHMTPPSHMTPPPGHMAPPPGHMMPPLGIIQHHPLPLPHAQMPHPQFLRGGMRQGLPWLLPPNRMPPPPHGMQHVIPPPNVPLLGHHMRPPGKII